MKIFNGLSPKIFKTSIFFIMGIFLTLGLSISFQSILAAYTAPLANPAACATGNPGCDAPLNAGLLMQSKIGPLWINTSAASPIGLIVGNGKVGIGTANPGAKFSIQGTGSYGSTYSGLPSDMSIRSSEMTDSLYHSILQLVSIRQSLTTGKDANGFLGFTTIDDSNAQGMDDAGRIAIVNESGGSRNSPTAMSFWTSPGGGAGNNRAIPATEKVRITSAGNVGIGTTNPTYPLYVAGDIYSTSWIRTGGASGLYFQSYGGGWYMADSSWIRSYGNKNIYHNTGIMRTDGTFQVGLNGNRFIVNTSGNVGIGTTAPEGSLHVMTSSAGAVTANAAADQIIAESTSDGGISILTGNNQGQYLIFGTPSNNAHTFLYSNYNSGNPYLSFYLGGTAKMTVQNSGNVGIGTANPTAKLHVGGTAGVDGIKFPDNSVQTTAYTGGAGSISAANVSFGAFGSATGGGVYSFPANVGIGTAAPTQKLEIKSPYGDPALNGTTQNGILRVANSNDNSVLDMGIRSNGLGAWLQATDRTSLGTYRSLLLNPNGGNVGIGTANPTYKFHVAGTGYFSGNLTVGGNLSVSGADVAEEFKTTEDLAMGTVVIMAEEGIKTAKPSEVKYDKKVIGVVSDNPSVIMGKISDKVKAVVALVGVVKVKVTTQNGEIKKGDLLVTSDLSGHAMKATEEKAGTIIGKALENFSGQTGQITALINLQ